MQAAANGHSHFPGVGHILASSADPAIGLSKGNVLVVLLQVPLRP